MNFFLSFFACSMFKENYVLTSFDFPPATSGLSPSLSESLESEEDESLSEESDESDLFDVSFTFPLTF